MKKFDPDIIHVHTEFGTGWEGLICSKIYHIPVIGSYHTFFADPEYLKNIKAPDTKFFRDFVWGYSVKFLSMCDRIIVPSPITKKELQKHGLKEKIFVVSNGINIPVLLEKENIEELRNRYSLTGGINLVYAGRVAVEKSMAIAINAFRIVLNDHPDSRFLVIGDGAYFSELMRIIRKNGLEKNIILTGKISHDDLISTNLLRAGDIFFTSSKTENQPLSVLEAMSFGLPVVGVRARGMPALVRHGYNGYLAKPDDFIELSKYVNMLIRDGRLRNEMSANAMSEAKKHDIGIIAGRVEKIYERTIAECALDEKRFKIKLAEKAQEMLEMIQKRLLGEAVMPPAKKGFR